MRSYTLTDTEGTLLARMAEPKLEEHRGLSGLMALKYGHEALLARLALMRLAERSLDLQYYIWHDDFTGKMVLREALRAADRGVRVRILVDDMGSHPKDDVMLAMAAHPKIEVRYYNPARYRSLRLFNLVVEAWRMNHRMHNKTFLVDNSAVIIGGRNIGDEYFEAHPDVSFDDLDVLCFGPVVGEASLAFDAFWNDERSLPVGLFYPRRNSNAALKKLRANLERMEMSPYQKAYLTSLEVQAYELRLKGEPLPLEWGRARAFYDDPRKNWEDEGEYAANLLELLRPFADATTEELLIVSPYFVPGKSGVAWLDGFAKRGVKVSVLTNSLASTDVAIVHAGYAHYRKPMLKSGVSLYELKVEEQQKSEKTKRKWFGASRSSLHAKTYVFDRKFVFVGTLNLDPRSIELNTENGVVFESETFARGLAESFETSVAENSYRLKLDKRFLRWVDTETGEVLKNEPKSSWWRRFHTGLFALLPVESQL